MSRTFLRRTRLVPLAECLGFGQIANIPCANKEFYIFKSTRRKNSNFVQMGMGKRRDLYL